MKTTNEKLLAVKTEIKKYIDEHDFWINEEDLSFQSVGYQNELRASYSRMPRKEEKRVPATAQREEPETISEKYLDLEIIEPQVTPFSKFLFALIDARKLDDVTVYTKAQIDRRLFSKIRCEPDYNPSKPTVYRLLLALELNIVDAKELLEAAGYSFGKTSKVDYIVRHCVEHQIYDITEVNGIIYDNHERLI
ncbi:MAG: hypothetical protein NTV44_06685 [Firmicutes bacterium]|nr:hypothetical protein [Bacillota bacterium]